MSSHATSSRFPTGEESRVAGRLVVHARACDVCIDPLATLTNGLTLCPIGNHRALAVIKYFRKYNNAILSKKDFDAYHENVEIVFHIRDLSYLIGFFSALNQGLSVYKGGGEDGSRPGTPSDDDYSGSERGALSPRHDHQAIPYYSSRSPSPYASHGGRDRPPSGYSYRHSPSQPSSSHGRVTPEKRANRPFGCDGLHSFYHERGRSPSRRSTPQHSAYSLSTGPPRNDSSHPSPENDRYSPYERIERGVPSSGRASRSSLVPVQFNNGEVTAPYYDCPHRVAYPERYHVEGPTNRPRRSRAGCSQYDAYDPGTRDGRSSRFVDGDSYRRSSYPLGARPPEEYTDPFIVRRPSRQSRTPSPVRYEPAARGCGRASRHPYAYPRRRDSHQDSPFSRSQSRASTHPQHYNSQDDPASFGCPPRGRSYTPQRPRQGSHQEPGSLYPWDYGHIDDDANRSPNFQRGRSESRSRSPSFGPSAHQGRVARPSGDDIETSDPTSPLPNNPEDFIPYYPYHESDFDGYHTQEQSPVNPRSGRPVSRDESGGYPFHQDLHEPLGPDTAPSPRSYQHDPFGSYDGYVDADYLRENPPVNPRSGRPVSRAESSGYPFQQDLHEPLRQDTPQSRRSSHHDDTSPERRSHGYEDERAPRPLRRLNTSDVYPPFSELSTPEVSRRPSRASLGNHDTAGSQTGDDTAVRSRHGRPRNRRDLPAHSRQPRRPSLASREPSRSRNRSYPGQHNYGGSGEGANDYYPRPRDQARSRLSQRPSVTFSDGEPSFRGHSRPREPRPQYAPENDESPRFSRPQDSQEDLAYDQYPGYRATASRPATPYEAIPNRHASPDRHGNPLVPSQQDDDDDTPRSYRNLPSRPPVRDEQYFPDQGQHQDQPRDDFGQQQRRRPRHSRRHREPSASRDDSPAITPPGQPATPSSKYPAKPPTGPPDSGGRTKYQLWAAPFNMAAAADGSSPPYPPRGARSIFVTSDRPRDNWPTRHSAIYGDGDRDLAAYPEDWYPSREARNGRQSDGDDDADVEVPNRDNTAFYVIRRPRSMGDEVMSRPGRTSYRRRMRSLGDTNDQYEPGPRPSTYRDANGSPMRYDDYYSNNPPAPSRDRAPSRNTSSSQYGPDYSNAAYMHRYPNRATRRSGEGTRSRPNSRQQSRRSSSPEPAISGQEVGPSYKRPRVVSDRSRPDLASRQTPAPYGSTMGRSRSAHDREYSPRREARPTDRPSDHKNSLYKSRRSPTTSRQASPHPPSPSHGHHERPTTPRRHREDEIASRPVTPAVRGVTYDDNPSYYPRDDSASRHSISRRPSTRYRSNPASSSTSNPENEGSRDDEGRLPASRASYYSRPVSRRGQAETPARKSSSQNLNENRNPNLNPNPKQSWSLPGWLSQDKQDGQRKHDPDDANDNEGRRSARKSSWPISRWFGFNMGAPGEKHHPPSPPGRTSSSHSSSSSHHDNKIDSQRARASDVRYGPRPRSSAYYARPSSSGPPERREPSPRRPSWRLSQTGSGSTPRARSSRSDSRDRSRPRSSSSKTDGGGGGGILKNKMSHSASSSSPKSSWCSVPDPRRHSSAGDDDDGVPASTRPKGEREAIREARSLTPKESDMIHKFMRHCEDCAVCRNPGEAARQGWKPCSAAFESAQTIQQKFYVQNNSVFSAGDYGSNGHKMPISLPEQWRTLIADMLRSFSKGLAGQDRRGSEEEDDGISRAASVSGGGGGDDDDDGKEGDCATGIPRRPEEGVRDSLGNGKGLAGFFGRWWR